jgi:hypothetical protein
MALVMLLVASVTHHGAFAFAPQHPAIQITTDVVVDAQSRPENPSDQDSAWSDPCCASCVCHSSFLNAAASAVVKRSADPGARPFARTDAPRRSALSALPFKPPRT